jgi:hypothetical protein
VREAYIRYEVIVCDFVDGGWLLIATHHNRTPHIIQETTGVPKGIFERKRERGDNCLMRSIIV